MQERFRFRVWHKPLKMMHYNDFVITATGYVAPIQEEVKGIDYMMRFNQQDLEFDKQCEIMQCTGLKDFEGNLIFEGDLIKSNWHIYIVGFSIGSFDITDIDTGEKYFISAITVEHSQIIGNKYNNPELLKGGEE